MPRWHKIRGSGAYCLFAPKAIRPRCRAVNEAIAHVDRGQAVGRMSRMEELVSETVAQPRFRAELVGAFAGLAPVLSAVGALRRTGVLG